MKSNTVVKLLHLGKHDTCIWLQFQVHPYIVEQTITNYDANANKRTNT